MCSHCTMLAGALFLLDPLSDLIRVLYADADGLKLLYTVGTDISPKPNCTRCPW